MDSSLFAFIWKFSRRQQIALLALTLVTFPFIYASLELPKRIINNAISADGPVVQTRWGETGRIEYLLVLCLAFLAAVLIAGLLKMRLNTMKGVAAERLLRRLRYTLISRMMRFPAPYFRTTSQGELVSMITSESEPMGGLMGDALAQPVFLAGQMLTILSFLFLQSVWFGLASVALIPLQAWLIPMLQRQINLLNKDRIHELRALSSEIGETAAGIGDLRANGGWRYRKALISDRLGRLFEIRRRIYNKKFFMKFLNNMIGHLTPFVFYSAGGILAIRGEITVGALVAALAAYKDLAAPWRELLTYYNQVQDMSLRWHVMAERFQPPGMIAAELFEGQPAEVPHLRGPIEVKNVTVRDGDSGLVLEDISISVPGGGLIAVESASDAERRALAQVLTREILPASGSVVMAGRRLEDLHQAVIAARIGYADSRPSLFAGTLGENVLMPLRNSPQSARAPRSAALAEALRAGGSGDPVDVEWIGPAQIREAGQGDLREWWLELADAMGTAGQLFRQALQIRLEDGARPGLEREIVRLRPAVWHRLETAGLAQAVHHFDPGAFNPAMALGSNMLFAAPTRELAFEELTGPDSLFLRVIREQGLAAETLEIGLGVADTLIRTFGDQGSGHPLFLKLGLDQHLFQQLAAAAGRQAAHGTEALGADERALLMTVPFFLSEEQIGPGLPEVYKARILAIRREHGAALIAQSGGAARAITPDAYLPRFTVLENAVYGKLSMNAGAAAEAVGALVAEALDEAGLRQRLSASLADLPAGLSGALLDPAAQERAAFVRAAIKRPDILILDKALASHSSESRLRTRQRLQALLPDTTLIFMEDHFAHPERYDLHVKISGGRIGGILQRPPVPLAGAMPEDFARKLAAVSTVPLLAQLDSASRRLLAFSARWHQTPAGAAVFRAGGGADAVYLCTAGRASIRWPDPAPDEAAIMRIGPGQIIGDLAVILNAPRQLDLIADEPCTFLRIGAAEYRSVIENDARAAYALLKTVSGHLVSSTGVARAAMVSAGSGSAEGEARSGTPGRAGSGGADA